MKGRLHGDRLWPPLLMMAGISILSGSAGVQTGGISFTGMDKLGHGVFLGLLGIAWARSFRAQASAPLTRWVLAFLLTGLFGLADEMHQFHNPERSFEWGDLAADLAGGGLASALYLKWAPFRFLLEWRPGGYRRLQSRGK